MSGYYGTLARKTSAFLIHWPEHFFWSENILWKEDLQNHRSVVFLGERDSIINAAKVHDYLRGRADEGKDDLSGSAPDAPWRVIWCPDLDHGQVFDLPVWRGRLKDEVLVEARRARRYSGSIAARAA